MADRMPDGPSPSYAAGAPGTPAVPALAHWSDGYERDVLDQAMGNHGPGPSGDLFAMDAAAAQQAYSLGPTSALEGDFYSAPPTMRGVCFNSHDDEPMQMGHHFGFGSGFDPKPTLKGMEMGGLGGLPGYEGACQEEWAIEAPGPAGGFAGLLQQFGEQHRPRPVPDDLLFPLEPTSIIIKLSPGFGPKDIMNDCMTTLQEHASSTILSLDTAEVSFKVKTFADAGGCSMKATLYDGCDGTYTLELQRLRGECVAFHRVHRLMADYFSKWPTQAWTPSSAEGRRSGLAARGLKAMQLDDPDDDDVSRAGYDFFQPPPSPIGDPSDDNNGLMGFNLGPLLDGALPQAEVSSALAGIARASSDAAAALAGSDRVLQEIRKLIQSGEPEVVYSTARLLQQLVRSDKAAAWFSEGGLLASLEQALRSQALCDSVQGELDRVVCEAKERFPCARAA